MQNNSYPDGYFLILALVRYNRNSILSKFLIGEYEMPDFMVIGYRVAVSLAFTVLLVTQSACGGESSGTETSASGALSGALDSGGTLVIRVAGTEAGVSHDVLYIAGSATLAGTLEVEFAAEYTPTAGHKFTILQAEGGVSGAFATVRSNAAMPMQVSQDKNTVVVTLGS